MGRMMSVLDVRDRFACFGTRASTKKAEQSGSTSTERNDLPESWDQEHGRGGNSSRQAGSSSQETTCIGSQFLGERRGLSLRASQKYN